MNKAATVIGALTLTQGTLTSSSVNKLTLGSAATISGGSSASYVRGPMDRVTTGTSVNNLLFPIGDANGYRPATLSLNQTTAGAYTAEVKSGAPTVRTLPSTYSAGTVSSVRYYVLSGSGFGGLSNGSLKINYGADDLGSTDPVSMKMVKSNGSAWEDRGGSVDLMNESITSSITFASFGDFALVTNAVPLPITLLNFSAAYEPANRRVKLDWTTVREINNDFFTIERSRDAIHFEAVKEIKGAGNTAERLAYTTYDENPLPGTSYYRLRQTDFDGTHTYSKLSSVQNGSVDRNDFTVAPNPFTGRHLNLLLSGEPMTEITVVLYGSLGQTIYEGQVLVDANNRAEVSLGQQLSHGIYWLKVGQGSQLSTRRVLVINP